MEDRVVDEPCAVAKKAEPLYRQITLKFGSDPRFFSSRRESVDWRKSQSESLSASNCAIRSNPTTIFINLLGALPNVLVDYSKEIICL